MNLLLDTHVFLWLRHSPNKLSEKVLTAYFDINNDTYLSMASIWEIQIKLQLGKIEIIQPLQDLINQQIANNGLQILPIESEHIFALDQLPSIHKDPFDRLILAQAKLENLALASADSVFDAYDIDLFW